MFVNDKSANKINKLYSPTFKEHNFYERYNLQEWLLKSPKDCFGENILIVQKESSDFDNTNERLDLLALDKDGNLIIIENKRDCSGVDVTWQALKYASYVASFTEKYIGDI